MLDMRLYTVCVGKETLSIEELLSIELHII